MSFTLTANGDVPTATGNLDKQAKDVTGLREREQSLLCQGVAAAAALMGSLDPTSQVSVQVTGSSSYAKRHTRSVENFNADPKLLPHGSVDVTSPKKLHETYDITVNIQSRCVTDVVPA